ncbi:uncharacterized [Lates japonicus]
MAEILQSSADLFNVQVCVCVCVLRLVFLHRETKFSFCEAASGGRSNLVTGEDADDSSNRPRPQAAEPPLPVSHRRLTWTQREDLLQRCRETNSDTSGIK